MIEVKSKYILYDAWGNGPNKNLAKHEYSKKLGYNHEIWIISDQKGLNPRLDDVII